MEVVVQGFVPSSIRELYRDRDKLLSDAIAQDALARLVSAPGMEPVYQRLKEQRLAADEWVEIFTVFAECAFVWCRAVEVDTETGDVKTIKHARREADKKATALLDTITAAGAELVDALMQLDELDGHCNSAFHSSALLSFWPLIEAVDQHSSSGDLKWERLRGALRSRDAKYYPKPVQIIDALALAAYDTNKEAADADQPGWNQSQKSSPRDYQKTVFDELLMVGQRRLRYTRDTDLIELFTEPMLSAIACAALNIGGFRMSEKIAGQARRDWFKARG